MKNAIKKYPAPLTFSEIDFNFRKLLPGLHTDHEKADALVVWDEGINGSRALHYQKYIHDWLHSSVNLGEPFALGALDKITESRGYFGNFLDYWEILDEVLKSPAISPAKKLSALWKVKGIADKSKEGILLSWKNRGIEREATRFLEANAKTVSQFFDLKSSPDLSDDAKAAWLTFGHLYGQVERGVTITTSVAEIEKISAQEEFWKKGSNLKGWVEERQKDRDLDAMRVQRDLEWMEIQKREIQKREREQAELQKKERELKERQQEELAQGEYLWDEPQYGESLSWDEQQEARRKKERRERERLERERRQREEKEKLELETRILKKKQEELAIAEREKQELEKQLLAFDGKNKGPAYEYDLTASEERQRFWVESLKRSGGYPKDFEGRHRLFIALASRGATHFTDEMARDLYLGGDSVPSEALKDVLEKKVLWDFQYRKKIFEKFQVQTNKSLSGSRSEQIANAVNEVRKYFAEDSVPRMELLEDVANRFHTNQFESFTIEKEKNSSGASYEEIAQTVFRQFISKVGDKPAYKFEMIKFLMGKGSPPKTVQGLIQSTIGESRLRRQFQALTPELKALVLNSMITPPRGLYASPDTKEKLIRLAIGEVPEHQKEARLLLEAMLYSMHEVAPHQETLSLAFILGQAGDSSATAPKKFRVLLESMGNSGQSIAQKVYQRRLLPPEYLAELKDVQDRGRVPTRFDTLTYIGEVLNNPRIDEILEVKEFLGAASSKVVLRVRYKDGSTGDVDDRALKLLRKHFAAPNEIEADRLGRMLDYLEKEGGPTYGKFRPVLTRSET